jgi:hypothetical protein
VFAATHNFFALHLVTGGHAFRLVAPYAGPHADALFNLGVVAGYAAVGAPPFHTAPLTGPALSDPDPTTQNALTPSVLLALCRDDEHDYKLAYSAWRQAAHWHDPAYLDVARAYLKRFS